MPIIPHLRGCRKCTASSRLAWTLEWAPIKKNGIRFISSCSRPVSQLVLCYWLGNPFRWYPFALGTTWLWIASDPEVAENQVTWWQWACSSARHEKETVALPSSMPFLWKKDYKEASGECDCSHQESPVILSPVVTQPHRHFWIDTMNTCTLSCFCFVLV